ncbi:MAG TPA: biotin/lipoate--protein ligase family protein [Azospirillum sp.]|nr:biotin/lipoate--protein ligase family protein [Azospirillum sp.]
MTTTDAPHLPPLFRPFPITDGSAFDAARAQAGTGAEPGTLVWSQRPNRLECAVVLAPDRPLVDTRLVVIVFQLALADALAALGPPRTVVSFHVPGRVAVNGADVGAVRFAAPPDAAEDDTPAWAVVGADVDVLGAPDDDSPGRHPDRTALREEGFGDLPVPDLLESVARHLLSWLDVWETEGPEPVRRAWRHRFALEG